MQSTTMGLVRGAVILALALGLPAIAFFGVPGEVRTFLDSDVLPWNRPSPSGRAADPFAAPAAGESPDAHAAHEHTPQPPSFFARADSIQAHYETSDDSAGGVAPALAEARVLRHPIFRPLGDAAELETVRHVPADGRGEGSAPHDDPRVKAIEARLRDWGALNYQLQQAAGGQYRFVCLCANERGEQRSFEALSRDQCQAMQTVLEQVAAWRGTSAANRSTYWR